VSAGTPLAIEGCAIATMDAAGREFASGHIVIEGDRIAEVGEGPAPTLPGARVVDGSGCLATPGLINCHHHLYQWLTRGLAQQSDLFEWLESLYPMWACIDAELTLVAASAGLAALAHSGCTTSADHHYVFPRGAPGVLEATIDAAETIGLRFHVTRGSMNLGRSAGGLPPDGIVEDDDHVLAATQQLIDEAHDPAPSSMLQVAVAPCSPFSVTRELMRSSAELARANGVRLHTHLAETSEEEHYCLERFGVRPAEYLDDLGWLGDDVWLAHCVHLSADEVARFGATGTGVAHCPSSNARLGAGVAPVEMLHAAGAPVGLGADGAASNEAGELAPEMKGALFAARLRGGPSSLTPRDALRLATTGGARCLGRGPDIGSLESGKQADVAVWDLSGLGHSGIVDPIAALVLGPVGGVKHSFVGGRQIVEDRALITADSDDLAVQLGAAARRLVERCS